MQARFKSRRAITKAALGVIKAAVAVKSIHCFTVVLQAYLVEVEERRFILGCLSAKNAVTLVVFASGEGRTGNVDDKIQFAAALLQLQGLDSIVCVPAVFADEAGGIKNSIADRQ